MSNDSQYQHIIHILNKRTTGDYLYNLLILADTMILGVFLSHVRTMIDRTTIFIIDHQIILY